MTVNSTPLPSFVASANEPVSGSVFNEALGLSIDDRAELAVELLVSLDGEADADVDAAWDAASERRARRVMQDGSRGRTWQQVRDELLRARKVRSKHGLFTRILMLPSVGFAVLCDLAPPLSNTGAFVHFHTSLRRFMTMATIAGVSFLAFLCALVLGLAAIL